MKNILIFAEGKISDSFIDRINQKRVGDHHYIVMSASKIKLPKKLQVSMELIHADPTSYLKVRKIFRSYDISMVFIMMKRLEDAGEALKNIRRIDEKLYVVLLDLWNGFGKLEQNSTHIIDSNEILSNRLYNYLPGVPVVAQSIGLGEGEVMEVLVPFGSAFAYRHVGSINQVKWKIAAIYRNNKLILPTNATMIRPQDTLLMVGKPQVLSNIFRRIHDREGLFPEPFGRNLLLRIDMDRDSERMIEYVNEAKYLCDKLEDRRLYVRVYNPGDFDKINLIRDMESESVDVMIIYEDKNDEINSIEEVIREKDIGLIFSSMDSIEENILSMLYDNNKLLYVFGDDKLEEIEKSVIIVTNKQDMEAISSFSFYMSETLRLKLCLCIYEPEGSFEDSEMIVEHYETLSHIFQYQIEIEKKVINPIRALSEMEKVMQIAPMKKGMQKENILTKFSTDINKHILRNDGHPKLLIPVDTL